MPLDGANRAAVLAIPGVVLAGLLVARERRIRALAAERGRLVAQAIEAEERERRRISEALHDESVQNLLAARLDIAAAREGDPQALDRVEEEIDRSLGQLRESVAELHPVALRESGLGSALKTLARKSERRGGFECTVRIEPGATEICDELLLSLVRELLANAVKHAQASSVCVTLDRQDENVVLEVSDDGRGMTPGRPRAALREGHIGLASSEERVKALTGRFEVESEPGRGTTVRASIPVSACELTSSR